MSESDIAQLRLNLEKAFDFITQMAGGQTKINERLQILFENTANLETRLESARGETVILSKVVAYMIGRECMQSRNPAKRLDELLAHLFTAADIFAFSDDDPALDAELRKLGVERPEPTAEEKQQREQERTIAASYRGIGNHLRDEALKIINASHK